MKNLIIIVALFSAMTASAGAGNDSGNGGGGVYQNGKYQTFYSAGFYTEPIEEQMTAVPQLDQLLYYLENADLSSEVKARYISHLVPTSARKYFRIQSNHFTSEVKNRIIEEFRRVTNAPTEQLRLYAVTDIYTSTTFLLPGFYALNAIQQMAILYHESYWLAHNEHSYKQVITSEMAFQAHLERPNSPEYRLHWLETINDMPKILQTTIAIDLGRDYLKGLVIDGQFIRFADLVSDDYITCSEAQRFDCLAFVNLRLYQLKQRYPQSKFIELFIRLTASHDKTLAYSMERYGGGGGGDFVRGLWSMANLARVGLLDLKTTPNKKPYIPYRGQTGTSLQIIFPRDYQKTGEENHQKLELIIKEAR